MICRLVLLGTYVYGIALPFHTVYMEICMLYIYVPMYVGP